jgi:hypothetical protein
MTSFLLVQVLEVRRLTRYGLEDAATLPILVNAVPIFVVYSVLLRFIVRDTVVEQTLFPRHFVWKAASDLTAGG